MIIGIMKIKMIAPWVHSLKEKRMEVKSIISKVKNKFNVSIAEIEEQDTHQTIVIGLSCVSNSSKHANATLNEILNYIDSNFESEIVEQEIEII